jgi:hypothetical protein
MYFILPKINKSFFKIVYHPFAKKFQKFKKKMLTRKRKRMQDVQDRFAISTQSAHFDPILEALTKFLDFKDCAHVDITNSLYHSKTWKYFLQAPTDNRIEINTKSIPWILKYRNFLKYQNLWIDQQYNIDLSLISQLQSLSISSVFIASLPLLVKNYEFWSVNANIPYMNGTKSISMINSKVTSYSESVKNLSIIAAIVDCEILPGFPNIKTLEINCNDLVHPSCIFPKYPNLRKLTISCNRVNFIQAIQSFKHKLVISSWELIDISSFSSLQCSELDLSNCSSIQDYSFVSHVPIVKKYEKLL